MMHHSVAVLAQTSCSETCASELFCDYGPLLFIRLDGKHQPREAHQQKQQPHNIYNESDNIESVCTQTADYKSVQEGHQQEQQQEGCRRLEDKVPAEIPDGLQERDSHNENEDGPVEEGQGSQNECSGREHKKERSRWRCNHGKQRGKSCGCHKEGQRQWRPNCLTCFSGQSRRRIQKDEG